MYSASIDAPGRLRENKKDYFLLLTQFFQSISQEIADCRARGLTLLSMILILHGVRRSENKSCIQRTQSASATPTDLTRKSFNGTLNLRSPGEKIGATSGGKLITFRSVLGRKTDFMPSSTLAECKRKSGLSDARFLSSDYRTIFN